MDLWGFDFPLILGCRISQPIRHKMIKVTRQGSIFVHFLTKHCVATQAGFLSFIL